MKKSYFTIIVLFGLLFWVCSNYMVGAVNFFISGSGLYVANNVVMKTLNSSVGGLFGWSVAAGDINNDTYADMIVGAYNMNTPGGSESGQVSVFFGSSNGIDDISSYANPNITLNGTVANYYLGYDVAAGDVNNDSYADIIVGVYGADPSGNNEGQVYVFFGADYTTAINEDSLSYANLTINGTTGQEQSGYVVATGDINNDSYDDVIVGMQSGLVSVVGQVFVFFGAAYPSAVGISYNDLDANITLNGTQAFDRFGASVASGDVNNDSYSDIIVGSETAQPSGASNAGQAYVFFGADFIEKIDPTQNASEYANITINGTTSNYFGHSVASGDFNNDSYADVTVGAYYASPVSDTEGQVFVFFGADFTEKIDPTSTASGYANITISGTVAQDQISSTPNSLAIVDFNKDNCSDLIIGAKEVDPPPGADAGQAYVFFGDNYPSTVGVSYSALIDANITLNGTAADDYFGCSVASGDFNNDSYTDVIVGAYAADSPGLSNNDAGRVHIFEYDDISPVITLDSPSDNGYDTDGDVNLSFTVVDANYDQCVLWFRSNESNWGSNDTVSYTNNIQTNIYLNLTDAVYVWTVYCNDTANNYNNTVENRTLTVDRVAPVTPALTAPSDTNINPRDSISYTCESSDATAGISKWTWTLTKPQSGGTVTKTGGEVSINSQTFSGDDTNLAGTYTVTCEAEDKAGWKSSASSTFDVFFSHAPGDGGGHGVGPSAAAQLDFTVQEEMNIKEPQGAIMTFTLDGTAVHTIKLRAVTTRTVTIIIESTPIEITLEIGETKLVDVDADGVDDISVTLNDIVDGVADISTKRLIPLPGKEEVPVEEVSSEEAPEEEAMPTAEVSSKAWLWILIISVVVVICVGYFMLKKKSYDIMSVEEKEPSVKRKKK